ncbi:MAG: hypothetical protein ACI9MC_001366 [Kiritimatiellia bacterium]|jgi:hypothetical protein
MKTRTLLLATTRILAICLLNGCGATGACEFWSTGGGGISERYYCWNGEDRDFCESAAVLNVAYHAGQKCQALGYSNRCSQSEMGEAALQDQWTSSPGCDSSSPPIGRTPGAGGGDGGDVSCTDSMKICAELTNGSVEAFQNECETAGDVFSNTSCAPGAYICLGGTGSSGGEPVSIDIHWPAGVCDRAEFKDSVYLRGTCENALSGTFSGPDDSCCTGNTRPVLGGTVCQ